MTHRFPGAVPEIPVRDVINATAYYESRLGFTRDWMSDEYGMAGISRGDCRMFLTNTDFRQRYGTIGPIVVWLNLASRAAVDELYRDWRNSRAELVSAPEDKPWNLREFTASDLDGNLFRVFYDFTRELQP
jgi:uncharacterized glyoxalase superfamily protein PhnB